MFSINHNEYLKFAEINKIYPELKKIKIFEIEVLWSKIYPTDKEGSELAISDWFIDNNNSLTAYKNFNNVNQFAKNNNIDITYYTCETGMDKLHADYRKSLQYKIETFNFFLLSQTVEFTQYLKNEKYPFELYKGKDNPYSKFVKLNNRHNKILNLNRRPDWHRHLIAQTILGQFEGYDTRAIVTWLNTEIKAYNQHQLVNGKSEYFNFENIFLPLLSEEEMNNFISGERILKTNNLVFDKDQRNEQFTLRYVDVLDNYTDVGLEIVSESIFFGPFGDVSEKSLRPLLLGIPCIIAGGPDSFKILDKLGFKSYDLYTGYKDSERNNLIRFRSIIDYTAKLALMDNTEYSEYMNKLHRKCLPITVHNQDNFKTGQVIENFKKWIKEIHQ
jgi:hypothetical protein